MLLLLLYFIVPYLEDTLRPYYPPFRKPRVDYFVARLVREALAVVNYLQVVSSYSVGVASSSFG